jgi:hypothetical protein
VDFTGILELEMAAERIGCAAKIAMVTHAAGKKREALRATMEFMEGNRL